MFVNRVQKIKQKMIFAVFEKCARLIKQTSHWAPRCTLSLLMRLEHNTNDYRYSNSFVRNFYLFFILSAVEINPGISYGNNQASNNDTEAKNL